MNDHVESQRLPLDEGNEEKGLEVRREGVRLEVNTD